MHKQDAQCHMVFWPPENRPQVNFCPNPVLFASGKWVSVKTAANSVVKSSVQSNCYFFFSHPRKAIVLYWSKYNWRIGYFWLHNTDNEQIHLLPLIFTDYLDELLLLFWLSTVEGQILVLYKNIDIKFSDTFLE